MSTPQEGDEGSRKGTPFESKKEGTLAERGEVEGIEQEGRLSVASLMEEHQETIALSTPSISMSAGADPWADPSPAAVVASAVPPSKRSGDNPWASDTPDLVSGDSQFKTEIDQTTDIPIDGERWGEFHLPKLGNAVARYWDFKPGFLQLNNGTYTNKGERGNVKIQSY